jgi:low affinity Fe/Cu permease
MWMVMLFITRTEDRDTQAIHAKLDDLLRAERQEQSWLG